MARVNIDLPLGSTQRVQRQRVRLLEKTHFLITKLVNEIPLYQSSVLTEYTGSPTSCYHQPRDKQDS